MATPSIPSLELVTNKHARETKGIVGAERDTRAARNGLGIETGTMCGDPRTGPCTMTRAIVHDGWQTAHNM
eukprot:2603067-Lingulodinium_polyedra.AAC.1